MTLASLLNEILAFEVTRNDGVGEYMCLPCILKLIKAVSFKRDCLRAYDVFNAASQKESEEEKTVSKTSTADWTFDAIDENIEIIEIDEKQRVFLENIECPDTEESDHFEGDTEPNIQETTNSLVFRKYKSKTKTSAFAFKCEICGKILGKFSSYKYHMDLHSDVAKYECLECHEKFKTKNAYTGHMATHTGLFSCDICGKSYRQAASLKSHKLSHDPSTAKPFFCSMCEKDFTQKSGLKKHLLTHTDSKMFKCMEVNCGKEFRYSSNYYVHLKSHRGEKDYECNECKKKFSSKEQVKRHKLIHTGEKPFVCEMCNRAFNRKSALTVHMGIHEKVKKYCCEKCKKGFSQPQGLRAHQHSCK